MQHIDPQFASTAAAADAALSSRSKGFAALAPSALTQPEAALRKHILVVDGDIALGKFLYRELSRRNFTVEVRNSGAEICRELEGHSYDLLLLDLNLPQTDGFALLQQIRQRLPQLPVLVLTAQSQTEQLVRALELGADDCLFKPFSFMELIARAKSLLRRSAFTPTQPAPAPHASAAMVGDLTLNREEHWVQRGERRIDLTAREFTLLEYLMNHCGKAVSRATLMKEVWNIQQDSTTNIVDVYMKYLRDKIDLAGEPKLIRTVRGVGYVLSSE